MSTHEIKSESLAARAARNTLAAVLGATLALSLMLVGCGGGGGGDAPAATVPAPTPGPAPAPAPAPAPPPAVPTAIGDPIGARVAATIGAAGGSLASADGGLVVEIPAGAFDRDREVAIQEIANHAHGRIGRAWRISPEGLDTPQPMTLRFRYSAADLHGTTIGLMGIGTQAADGTWRVYRRPVHDVATGTLSIRTRHFSDWSKVAGAQLLPGETAVEVGGQVELRVLRCEYAEDENSDDAHVPAPDELRVCDTEPLWNWSLRDWAVNGNVGGSAAAGTIQPIGDARVGEALYRAPASAPARNPVAVSVVLPEMWGVGEQTLVSNVTVNDAGARCSHLRHRPVWNATWGVRYTYTGANDDGSLRSTVRADVTARLVVSADGQYGVTWTGPATGTFQLDQEHVEAGTPPDVTIAAGGGAPYVDHMNVTDGSYVTLSVDFRNCEYTSTFALRGRVLVTNRGNVDEIHNAALGVAHASAPRAVPPTGNIQGGGAFTAHTALWGLMNPGGDMWMPIAGDPFHGGFAAEGQAGAAGVEWTFAPEG